MTRTAPLLTAICLLGCPPLGAAPRDYRFDGNISRKVLEHYLARAVTFSEFLHAQGDLADTDTGFHRRPVYLVPGRFQPGAEQPVWFDEPKFFLLGRKLTPEFIPNLKARQ